MFGSPGKNLKAAISKAAHISSSPAGPFDALLLLGDAFNSETPESDMDEILDAKIVPSLPTYFYSNDRLPTKIRKALENSKNGKLCKNLTCFGSSGVITTDKGVKIAAAGPGSSIFEIEKLKSQKNVDVLVTAHWPEHITLLSASANENETVTNTKTDFRISDLSSLLQPRYHFSPGKLFWEREPYRNEGYLNLEGGGGERPTQFISLAPVGNLEKSKWYYAFNISIPYIPLPLPENATANPLIEGARIKATQKPASKEIRNDGEADSDDDEDLIYGVSKSKRKHVDGDEDRSSRRDSKRRGSTRRMQQTRAQRKPVDASTCFFCLSNPQLAQHFIVSIGNESYVTTAKGPLPKSNSSRLGCPGHILIIPLEHQPTIVSIEDQDSRKNVRAEMDKFRGCISKMFADLGYTAIAFEISRHNGIHFHTQVIPVPNELAKGVEEEFKTAAEMNGYTLTLEEVAETEDYFKVYLDGGKTLYVPLSPDSRFDLQFGRKVLATILDLPERSDWKKCAQNEEEEVKDAERFKELFSRYDFTLEE